MYMKQSLKRRFGMHAHVFIIMVCAFILPLLVCFIRDSMLYGMQQNGIVRSHNSYYIIEGAQPHHVEYFKHLEDFNVVYEDGTIYFHASESFDESKIAPLPEVDRDGIITIRPSITEDAPDYVQTYDDEIHDIILTIEDTVLTFIPMSGVLAVPSGLYEFVDQYLVLIVAFALLGMLVLYVMYSVHITNFCPEIGALRCMGASKRQIRRLFLAELLAMFFAAGIIAFALAYLLGYIMLEVFMRMDDINASMIWIIYHINPVNMLIIFGAMFVFVLCVYAVKMRRVMRLNPQQLASYSSKSTKQKHYRKKLALKKNTVISISKTLLARANKGFAQSIAIVVPAVVACMLVLVSVGALSAGAYIEPPYDITVRGMGSSMGQSGFVKSDFEFFDNLEGVQSLNYIAANSVPMDNHFIEVRGDAPRYGGLTIDGKRFDAVQILNIDSLGNEYITEDVRSALLENPHAVVMSTATPWAQYAVGDTVSVYKRKQTDTGVMPAALTAQDFNEPVQVTVGVLIDKPSLTTQTEMFVQQAIYEQLIDKSDSNQVEIILKDGVNHLQFAQMLRDELIGGEVGLMDRYAITDWRDIVNKHYMQAIGWYIFTGVAALVVFGVVLVVLYVLLSEHMRGQRQNIALMSTLGATHKTIRHIYLRQSAVATVVGLVLALGVGALVSGLWVISRATLGYVFTLSLPVIVAVCLIIVVMVLAINLPILKATTKNKLQMYNNTQEA